MMTPAEQERLKAAYDRLARWSDPRQGGDPTKRMRAMWPNPVDLAIDIRHVIRFMDLMSGKQIREPPAR